MALPDRPEMAHFSYFPFVMLWMYTFLDVHIDDWPHIRAWGERALGLPTAQNALQRAGTDIWPWLKLVVRLFGLLCQSLPG